MMSKKFLHLQAGAAKFDIIPIWVFSAPI